MFHNFAFILGNVLPLQKFLVKLKLIIMKKLLFLLIPAFMLGACCNNESKNCPEENEAIEGEHHCCKDGDHKCHHEMTEEQKADIAAWEDWANQTDEKKAELLNKRKECFDKKMAEKDEQEAKRAAIKEKMANWDNLSLDEKKAIFDEMPCGGKCFEGGHEGCGHHHGEGEHHCKHGEGHHCDGNHEGCEHKCQHGDGHHCEGNHEGCPNHKN